MTLVLCGFAEMYIFSITVTKLLQIKIGICSGNRYSAYDLLFRFISLKSVLHQTKFSLYKKEMIFCLLLAFVSNLISTCITHKNITSLS